MGRLALSAGKRPIRDGKQFNKLFGTAVYQDPILNRDGDIDYTLLMMAEIASDNQNQAARLAPLLKGADLYDTCHKIWDFVFKYIQYNQDKAGIEQLRTPARTWADRKEGVDCDCMAIFISAILRQLSIPHRFRVVKFSDGDFEHVYIVVPRNGSNLTAGQIIIDGVLHTFDREKPYYQAQDYSMNGMKTQLLNGLPIQQLNGTGAVNTYSAREMTEYNRKLKMFLLAQLNALSDGGEVKGINRDQAVSNIQYVLKHWDNVHDRVTAVTTLAEKERQYNPETRFFRQVLGFFDGAASCQDVCQNGYVQLDPQTVENIRGGVAGVTNDAFGDPLGMNSNLYKIQHANPVMILARNAYLAYLKLNLFNTSDKIAVCFFPVHRAGENYDGQWLSERSDSAKSAWNGYDYKEAYSRAFGLSAADHLSNRRILYDKILRRWNNLGGDWQPFKDAAIKGAHKMLEAARNLPGFQYWCEFDDRGLTGASGTSLSAVTPGYTLKGTEGETQVSGLGEPATAAILAAAGTIIAAMAEFFSALKKPAKATTDAATTQIVASNPTENPNPAIYPQAAISVSTGLWTDPVSGNYYNPVTGQWESNSSSTNKILLIGGAALAVGIGAFILFGNNNKSTKHEQQ